MAKSKKESHDDWSTIVDEARNHDLSLDERYSLFNKLEVPINFAISKVIGKFHTLPIERDDFHTIAWLAFEHMLKRYWSRPTRKGFITYLIDSVYWKCMDYACQFTNNKHKVLNFNHPEKNWIEYSTSNEERVYEQASLRWALEDYFVKYNISHRIQEVFNDYLNNLPHQQICEKHHISRNRLKLLVKQTIRDFSRFIH